MVTTITYSSVLSTDFINDVTVLDQLWFNTIEALATNQQAEDVNLLTVASMTPNNSTTQVASAVIALINTATHNAFNTSLYALIAGATFTGVVAGPTPAFGDNSTKLATTAFIQNELLSLGGSLGALYLPLIGGTLTGALVGPSLSITSGATAPTPAFGDNSTNVATTAFVHTAILSLGGSLGGAYVPLAGGTMTGPLGATVVAISSAGTAPTMPSSDNSNNIATTAFVHNAIATLSTTTGSTGGSTGSTGGSLIGAYLPLAGGSLSGALYGPDVYISAVGTALTMPSTDNSSMIATTAFVHSVFSSLSGSTTGSVSAVLTAGSTLYSSSGSWTAPDGVTAAMVIVTGGGGGGGGNTGTLGSAGGGAGATVIMDVSVSPGSSYGITVGGGGAGGGAGANGGNGGSSSFNGSVAAPGGIGGDGMSGGGWSGGGSGGSLTGTSGICINGGDGTDGCLNGTPPVVAPGDGGASYWGGGGKGSGGTVPGQPGEAWGSGGGGSYAASNPGGNGANGAVYVEWWVIG